MVDLTEYIINQGTENQEFSELAIRLIKERFGLIGFYNIDKENKDEATILQELGELYKQQSNCYLRYCGAHRLPNVLLSGADTIGPDISGCFAQIIAEETERLAFGEFAKEEIAKFSLSGRLLDIRDKLVIEEHGLCEEEVIQASEPGHGGPYNIYGNGNGSMVVFYDSGQMPEKLIPMLYPAPVPEAVSHILVAWQRPFSLL